MYEGIFSLMDISTIIGIVVAFGSLIVGYLIEGGTMSSLFLLSPFIIVFGGTVGAVVISYGLGNVKEAMSALFKSFSQKSSPDPEALIKKICDMADVCRKEGLLKLEKMVSDSDLQDDKYLMLKEGMLLATDSKNANRIQETLEADVESYAVKAQMQIDVFEGAGGFSPTLGIIGTIMGLVRVLANMSDAASLTKSISVAFIATLYGVVIANILYIPAANHLKICLKRQQVFQQMTIDGIDLLARSESSRNIANKLSLYYHAFPGGEKKYKAGIEN